jgi:hypothetical protein
MSLWQDRITTMRRTSVKLIQPRVWLSACRLPLIKATKISAMKQNLHAQLSIISIILYWTLGKSVYWNTELSSK